MKSLKKIIFIFIFLSHYTTCFSQRDSFEAYYLHIKDYPSLGASPSWGEGSREVQGIAHDQQNWYITSTGGITVNKFIGGVPQTVGYKNCYMWKIPVDVPLDQDFTNNPRVKETSLLQIEQFARKDSVKGYTHWGDVDYYLERITNTGYLVVPATSDSLPSPALLLFRASDMKPVGYGKLPTSNQDDIGWCAVDASGKVFTSNDNPDVPHPRLVDYKGTSILEYSIDWDSLKPDSKGIRDIGSLIHYRDRHTLIGPLRRFSNGVNSTLLSLHNMQGGEFSPSNEILYISNGSGKCKTFGAGSDQNDGIHAIDKKTWTEIEHSTNHDTGEPNYFDFHYDPGCGVFEANAHTPEGLTIWDLDNGRAPHISGQLHVLVADVFYLETNTAGIGHFSGRLYVDESKELPAVNDPPSGTKDRPFFTIKDAFTFYPIWDGAEVVITKGAYEDIGHYSSRVKITSRGGNAIIGNAGTSIKGIVLYEHPDYKGDYRYFDSNVPDLDLGTINFADVASSLKVYNVKQVILYDGHDYSGDSFIVTKDNADLTPTGWNDRIGSLKIIR